MVCQSVTVMLAGLSAGVDTVMWSVVSVNVGHLSTIVAVMSVWMELTIFSSTTHSAVNVCLSHRQLMRYLLTVSRCQCQHLIHALPANVFWNCLLYIDSNETFFTACAAYEHCHNICTDAFLMQIWLSKWSDIEIFKYQHLIDCLWCVQKL